MLRDEILNEFKTLFLDLKSRGMAQEDLEQINWVKEGDDADKATEDRETLLTLKLAGRRGFFMRKIEGALAKIEEGTFGECEECGGDITLARLRARPTAELCIHCKEEQERAEGHIPYSMKSHTHGKGLSTSNVVELKVPGGGDGNETDANEKVAQAAKIINLNRVENSLAN